MKEAGKLENYKNIEVNIEGNVQKILEVAHRHNLSHCCKKK